MPTTREGALGHLVSGTLDILKSELDEASVESFVPYTPTLGHYISTSEAADRLANVAQQIYLPLVLRAP